MFSTRRLTLPLASFATLAAAATLALAPPALADRGPGGGGGHGGQHGLTHLDLPTGFAPEGIATGPRHTAYLGSRVDGDIYALDLHSGQGQVISQGPGTPSLGLKLDRHGLLWVSGGSGGDARVVDSRTGEIVASWQLVPAGTPAFINDVVLTDRAAYFTDSADNAVYRISYGGHGHHGHGRGGDDHGHRDGHGEHGDLSSATVTRLDLTGAWQQLAGINANGITTTPDGRALLVVNSANGTLYRVDRHGVASAVDLDGFTVTDGDGLLREGDTLYAVQNQLNRVAVIDLAEDGRSGELEKTLISADFDVPTTIARSGGDLYLPDARFTTPQTPETDYWVTGIDD